MRENAPSLRHIIATVRNAGPKGITAEAVARICSMDLTAVRKALDLQVQAGIMGTEEAFQGEKHQGCIYRMREGLPK